MTRNDEVPVFGQRVVGQRYVVRRSAYAVIECKEGLLAVAMTPIGHFLPGGGIEPDETPGQAVARETLEECGLVVEPGLTIAHAIQLVYSESEDTYFEKPSVFLRATLKGPQSSPSEDDHQLLWMPRETAAASMAHASHGWIVRYAAQLAVTADERVGRCAPSRARR